MKHLKYLLVTLGLLISSQADAACGGGTGCWWVGGTGTWDNSTTTHWASSSGGAGSVAVPIATDAITFDGSSGGGTVTVAATINGTNTVASITSGAFTGTLDFSVNNPSITMAFLNSSGAGTRTLKMGSSTFTLNSASAPLQFTATTGLTLNAGTSTLVINGATAIGTVRSIIFGVSQTWATVTISDPSNSGAYSDVTSTANAVITTLNLTAPLVLRIGTPLTVTNAINWAGTAYNNALSIFNSVGSTTNAITLSSAGGTINWAALAGIHFVTNTVTATNSFDMKGNAGVTITGPSGGGHIIGGGL